MRAKPTLGLRLSRQEVFAVCTVGTGDRREVAWASRQVLTQNWSVPTPDEAARRELGGVLQGLLAPGRVMPGTVKFGLPDPLFVSRVFALDALPRAERARIELVNWRLQKEFHLQEEMTCACQSLGRDGKQELLLGMAIAKVWLAWFTEIANQVRLPVGRIGAAMCYRFNRWHDRIAADGHAGVLIALDTDAWSLCAWDSQVRVRFLHGRWREAVASTEGALSALAVEIERVIRGYVQTFPGSAVDRIFVAGDREESRALMAFIDARTREGCVYLAEPDGHAAGKDSEPDPGALAMAWGP